MRYCGFLVTGLLVVLLASQALAGPVVGKITEVVGTVQLALGGNQAALAKVGVGKGVQQGDLVVTAKQSTAKIDFSDGSVIKLGEKSKFVIRQKGLTAKQPTKLHLFSGKMNVKVKKAKVARASFEVSTPTAVAGVRGTWFVISFINGKTLLRVIEGAVALWNIGDEANEVRVNRGQSSSSDGQNAPSAAETTEGGDAADLGADALAGGDDTAGDAAADDAANEAVDDAVDSTIQEQVQEGTDALPGPPAHP